MNNEPVAWMVDGVLFTSLGAALNISFDIEQPCIPLYTHPAKEQDESFDRTASHMTGKYVSWTSCVACGQRVTGDSIHTCSPQLKQLTDEEIADMVCSGEYWELSEGQVIIAVHFDKFARAILRKAQSNERK